MTISSTDDPRAGPFNGNGSQTAFPFEFKAFSKEDLLVVRTDEDGLEFTLVLDSDYSVTLNADQNADPGGSVTYPISGDELPVGETLTIASNLDYTQETDITNAGGFYPQVIEDALDRTVMLVKQVSEKVSRALRVAVSTPDDVDVTLPVPSAQKIIGWNDTATGLVNRDITDFATVVAFAAWQSQTFDGDGVTTAFMLSSDPGNINNLDIAIGGVTQTPAVDFTLSGTTLTFTSAPPSGTDNVFVRWGQALPQGTTQAGSVSVLDAAGLFTATDAEAALAELAGARLHLASVTTFGADPSGVSDSTAAIQAAIDHYTQRYAAYPQHDIYSRGTLKGSTLARVMIYFPPGEYKITGTIDCTYRGFIHFFGRGAVLRSAISTPLSAPMIDARFSNEMSFDGLVFEAATDFTTRFLRCVWVGGSDDKVADSTIAAKAVHFLNCEFRNPSDTCLDMVNDTGTFKASLDNSTISNCFFAGGAVGWKYAGYESWISNCNHASQTYAGGLLYDNASLACYGAHFTLANLAPAVLIDTDNNIDSVRFESSYFEQCTYVVQALGTASNKKADILISGGRIESQQNGIIAMQNRRCTVTLRHVRIGNTNANTAISCANTGSTLVLEQNQTEQDYGGAMANLASWLGKVQRFGFLAGNPVNYGPTGTVSIYVDPAAGSDFNEGYSSNRALATLGEAIRRTNGAGSTSIYLASGPDGAPRTYSPPASFEIWSGRIVLLPWEKHGGAATAINLRTVLDCSTNKVAVWGGLLELQNLTVSGGRAALCYDGVVTALSCVFPAAGANGALFGRMCRYTIKDCTFSGAGTDVGIYVGDQFGAMGALYSGGGNTWGAVTKYTAFAGITTHITSSL